MRLNLPIRTRLTLLYSAVLGLTFVAFFWICDLGFRHSIETTVNEASRTNLETVRRLLAGTATQGDARIAAELTDLANLWANGALLEVTDSQEKKYLFQSPQFQRPAPIEPRATGQKISYFTTNLDNQQFQVAVEKVQLNGKVFEIHAAVPTEPFDQALDRFREIEKEALPLLVILASLVGYWLSGRALSPVNQIILTAEQIGVHSLSRRLEVPVPRDELRRLTETLNAMLARIEASFQKITQFTADASHDLRTPIAVMRTTAEIALRRPRAESQYRDSLQRILATSLETTSLLENLLTLARADAGAGGFELHELNLNTHLKKAQQQADVLADGKALSFTVRMPDEPVWVRADAFAMDRLFSILVDNAVKYTPSGGRCEIILTRQHQVAHIEVKDTGIGIPESELETIFERFRRTDRSRSRETRGAGLGLAIARWIAQVHGGSITAESTLGAGSIFHIRLPVVEAA